MEEALLVALAVYLGSAAAIAAVTLPAALVNDLVGLGLPRRAVTTAGRLVMAEPVTGRRRTGSPTAVRDRNGRGSMARRMAVNEPVMRARYLLAAAKRLAQASRTGGFSPALRRERSYMKAHRRAGVRRARIARDYDRLARTATYMEWRTMRDERVTEDCRKRDRQVWHRDRPPFPPPGAEHVNCRCVPIKATAASLARAGVLR